MLYTKNIPCICRPPAYPWDITSLYLMGLFRTFFYNDMPMIYQVYSLNTAATGGSAQGIRLVQTQDRWGPTKEGIATAGGCIFLKFLRLTPKRRRGKTKKYH